MPSQELQPRVTHFTILLNPEPPPVDQFPAPYFSFRIRGRGATGKRPTVNTRKALTLEDGQHLMPGFHP
jgi:hypothetical protein